MANAWRTRRYLRVLYESPVILRVNRTHKKSVHLTQKNIPGKMLDVSEGGCGVEVAFFIPKGTRLNVFLDRSMLQMTAPGEKKPAAPAGPAGRSRIIGVVASSITRGIKKYRLGMLFSYVSKYDRELLAKFVKFHERRKEPRVEF